MVVVVVVVVVVVIAGGGGGRTESNDLLNPPIALLLLPRPTSAPPHAMHRDTFPPTLTSSFTNLLPPPTIVGPLVGVLVVCVMRVAVGFLVGACIDHSHSAPPPPQPSTDVMVSKPPRPLPPALHILLALLCHGLPPPPYPSQVSHPPHWVASHSCRAGERGPTVNWTPSSRQFPLYASLSQPWWSCDHVTRACEGLAVVGLGSLNFQYKPKGESWLTWPQISRLVEEVVMSTHWDPS